MLRDMLERRLEYARRDGERFFDAAQNARVVADAERYYRAMYYGSAASWNLRDTHMFDTLQSLLAFYGPDSRGVVWEHNSHVGNALATEMSARGELNVGQLCRARFGDGAYIVGFGTDHGTVAAASHWDEPMQRMRVRPAHARELRARVPRRPICPPSPSTCATRGAGTCAKSCWRPGSSAPSASSTARTRSSQATISTPASRTSSTSMCGSTKRAQSSRSRSNASPPRTCRRPIRSASEPRTGTVLACNSGGS